MRDLLESKSVYNGAFSLDQSLVPSAVGRETNEESRQSLLATKKHECSINVYCILDDRSILKYLNVCYLDFRDNIFILLL